MVSRAAWCAVQHWLHHAHGYCSRVHQQRAFRLRHPAAGTPTCGSYAMSSSVAERSWRTPCTNARAAVSVAVASVAAPSATFLLVVCHRILGLSSRMPVLVTHKSGR
jgi:hypothetical protein